MSMYTELLGAAIGKHLRSGHELTPGEALAELLRCRSQLWRSGSSRTVSGSTLDAVAEQLAYDIAIIELTRRLGVDCTLEGFDPSRHERARLERVLVSHGIPLEEIDEQIEAEAEPR